MTATSNTQPEAQPQPQPGALMRLETDERGRVRAVPSAETYQELTAHTGPAPEAPTQEGRQEHQEHPAPRVWRIWRQTDAEPGTAPAYDELSGVHRSLWFGPFADNVDASRSAWAFLCGWVERTYTGCHALRTPGATGLQLILHTLPWGTDRKRPHEYPVLDNELGRLLVATDPLHRMEHLALPDTLMRRYVYYDARVAHAAYMRRLPVLLGECADGPIHDEEDYVPYRAGKYRVAVTVPQGWRHIGLAHRANSSVPYGWEWPATPGDEWECWLDECELRLLREQGWPFAVRERILFAPEMPGSDPLREHMDTTRDRKDGQAIGRLIRELERIEPHRRRNPASGAYRWALRALALHPVGMWMKSDNKHTRHVDTLDDLTEADADATITPADEGGYSVTTHGDLSTYQQHWRRPEWTTTIYARERVTATRKALAAPRAHLLSIRGDAVHLADWTPTPDWTDTGKVGCYRKQLDATLPDWRGMPENGAALMTLRKQLEREALAGQEGEGA